MGPLAGIRVLELSSVVFGPYAGQFLGDYGADVVKIEAPDGDMARQVGACSEPGMAALFLGVNRNKRSVAIDLKRSEGRTALLRLVDRADVFMHNIRPQKLASLGLEPKRLLAHNPRLVYAGLHGFGEGGPYHGRPAYDDIIQGLSGMANLMERQGGAPRYLPTTVADKAAALVAVQAILAALLQRGRTGRGCVVEVPMFETVVSFALVEHLEGHSYDPPRGPIGYPRALSKLRSPMATLDGHLCIMPYTDRHWSSFFEAVGDSGYATDPRFSTMADRSQNVELLYARMAGHLRSAATTHWLSLCERLDIPAARVNRLEDLQSDPHLRVMGHFRRIHDRGGTFVSPANPVRFDASQPGVRMPPRLGEHTVQVLEEAGFGRDEIDQLLTCGAVGVRDRAEQGASR